MNKKLLLLTDYKGFFGSKQKSPIYRGGMDLPKLTGYFSQLGYDVSVRKFTDLDISKIIHEKPVVLYTSSEDESDRYKSFIEDIILTLDTAGILLIPKYSYLRAHNNKVFMEMLRQTQGNEAIQTIHSKFFGTLEELRSKAFELEYPVVIKKFGGAMSRGVAKADNTEQLLKIAARFSRSFALKHNVKELLRKLKYKDSYIRESFYRNKFIVQNFIEGMSNDWKVLVYGNKAYILYRGVKDNDFRASGSGKFIFDENIPEGILEYAWNIQNHFNVPHISLDVGFDGKQFHLLEFQFLYFGTTTLEKSPHYFYRDNGKWQIVRQPSDLETIYAESIHEYLTHISDR